MEVIFHSGTPNQASQTSVWWVWMCGARSWVRSEELKVNEGRSMAWYHVLWGVRWWEKRLG
jgi:hypothetical protein